MATKQKSATTKPNALTKLKDDHDTVRKLFDQYEKSKDEMDYDEKEAMVAQICDELTVHAQIEEEIFYPALREATDDELDELLDEAEVEHAGAKDLIAQLEEASADDELHDAKVTVLGEYVKHHAGEEENEIFPKVRKAGIDLEELGSQLEQRAEELKAEVAV
jgi:hemerythrin superfamily protein